VLSNTNDKIASNVKGLEPNMIDKFGNKWYIDSYGTDYAQKKVQLDPTAEVWVVESIDGQFKLCLVIDKTTVFEAQHVQQIGHEIDKLSAFKKAGRKFK
jgi:hypothetical protein